MKSEFAWELNCFHMAIKNIKGNMVNIAFLLIWNFYMIIQRIFILIKDFAYTK